ncbi:MAG: FHA domain-containing protein, partial [Pseudomonadota bacterium]
GAFEPVVAWVVVTSGPGRGNSRAMRYGMNSVGRDSSERVALDFGDEAISREAHAYLVYDDQQQDYYIQHGGKSNLVRVNSKPVLAPVELVHGDRIEIGNTELMFVPLCSDTFNWNEPSA